MTTSMSAFGKATAAGSARVPLLKTSRLVSTHAKAYSSATAPATHPNGKSQAEAKHAESINQRELFMNVLTANATKRDAKQYLARFKAPKRGGKGAPLSIEQERNALHLQDQDRLDRSGVNLGGLYAPVRAIAESPQFTQPHVGDQAAPSAEQALHVALVCLKAPETLNDAILNGVAITLSQLVKLDMRIAVVLDCGQGRPSASAREASAAMVEQGARLATAIRRHSTEGARLIHGALETSGDVSEPAPDRCSIVGTATVAVPDLLMNPLKRSVIPIIPAQAHTPSGKLVRLPTAHVMTALSGLFAGLPVASDATQHGSRSTHTSLDRIIVLDTAGGIPSKARADGAHVFVNLEQEYHGIVKELVDYGRDQDTDNTIPAVPSVYEQHRSNLSMIRSCLALLPSATSALIITPQEAASSSQSSEDDPSIGTGTRRRKNTLIHNLLTNKPMVSSSLPAARLPVGPTSGDASTTAIPKATLIKRGMPVTIVPTADSKHGWLPPRSGHSTLDLETDPRVDLPRLVHLIEDSFRRKIDLRHYLDRIRGRVAGLIIAGEYEGGAILTWERPPGAPADDSTRQVPYLDKFAVLSSSQGSSGVADIVFQSMVRTCFPKGVCWRSRKDNPVNKWYFERSEGTWKVPDSNWTMFWTGQGVVEGGQRWEDYVGVCRSVGPSWADKTMQVD